MLGYYLGHPNSTEPASGRILHEEKHPRGSWVSIVCVQFDETSAWTVAQRDDRRETWVDSIDCNVLAPPLVIDGRFASEADARMFHGLIMAAPNTPAINVPIKTAVDRQRTKFYNWEDAIYDRYSTRLTEEQVKVFATSIFNVFSSIVPRFELTTHGRGDCCYQRGLTEVVFVPWGWQSEVVVHEMAHLIVKNFFTGDKVQDHGPEFVGTFMLLLETYLGADPETMRATAAKVGLSFKFHKEIIAILSEAKGRHH